ncbi:hypothetical protein [Nocardiopsis sp. NPDC006938]|uniref:hypothetical protein n=1 Tax=Nocardiopsis sp. NPDC006938 TaxID=3364337 RepID=UPI00367CB6EC
MTDDEVRDALLPEEPGDALLLATLAALRAAGHTIEVLEADGVGPDTATAVIKIGGRTMRLTSGTW